MVVVTAITASNVSGVTIIRVMPTRNMRVIVRLGSARIRAPGCYVMVRVRYLRRLGVVMQRGRRLLDACRIKSGRRRRIPTTMK